MGKNTKYLLNTAHKEEKRFPNAVLRTYFIAFNLTNFVFDYKVAFSLSFRDIKNFHTLINDKKNSLERELFYFNEQLI